MRIGLLAASLALLGSGAIAAHSAFDIVPAAHAAPAAQPGKARRAVTVVSWDDSDESRRLALR